MTSSSFIDVRVNLILILVNSIAITLCKHERSFLFLFALCLLWFVLQKKYSKAVYWFVMYGILYWFSMLIIGIRNLSMFFILANIIRHLMIPLSYTVGLNDVPTGVLLEVFHRLHLPKAVGISTSVLLRFIPTIHYEYRSIQNSLKFRNVGTGFWNTLCHIPQNFECTIVPLLFRTTRIADELSAAAMVRGVRMNNDIISFEEVRFRRTDVLLTGCFTALIFLICVLD